MRTLPLLSVAVIASAVVTGSCGNDKAPTGAIEKKIREDVSAKTHLQAGAVTCPSNVKARKGAEFDCTARVEDQQVPVHVTLTNSSGTHFDFKPKKAVMLTATIVKGVQDQIKSQTGVDATVDCGGANVFVRDPGEVIECTAKTPTDNAPVRVTVKDTEGNVTFKVGE